jgi:hypothetical protein
MTLFHEDIEVRDMGTDSESPACALLVMCGACGRGIEAPLPIDRDALARFLAQNAWYLSILTAPGQVPILFGALCGDCAPGVFPPEIIRAAEERRQRMLQGDQ